MELFECQPYKAMITERACLLRHKKAIELNDPKYMFKRAAYSKGDFDWCLDCKIGKELMTMEKDINVVEPKIELTGDGEELKCDRCGRTPDKVNGFNQKKGRCAACAVIIKRCQNEGREVPDFGTVKGPKKKAAPDVSVTGQPSDSPFSSKRDFEDSKHLIVQEKPLPEILIKGLTLTIDFKTTPDLYKQILEEAAADLRTPEMQLLFYLREACKEGERLV